jgi:hypothetical protein
MKTVDKVTEGHLTSREVAYYLLTEMIACADEKCGQVDETRSG